MSRHTRAPGEWTVDRFFAGRPESRRLFDRVRTEIESSGPVTVDVMKTQIGFVAGTGFAWIWLPQMWVRNRRPDSITLALDLDRRISHPQVAEAVEPRPGHWMHHIVIERDEDLSDDVRQWLQEARDLALKRGLMPRARLRRDP